MTEEQERLIKFAIFEICDAIDEMGVQIVVNHFYQYDPVRLQKLQDCKPKQLPKLLC